MMSAHELGIAGEKAAVDYLRKKGYQIAETNWVLEIRNNSEHKQRGRKELDIIAYDGPELVIVEVKTRTNEYYGHPELAVTPQKQRNIFNATNAYIHSKKLDVNVRFDIISIVGTSPDNFQITHLINAFRPRVSNTYRAYRTYRRR